MAFPESFSTARLSAERLSAAHLADLRRLQTNPRMMEHLGGIRSAEQTEAYLARNLAHWDRHGFGLWLLRDAPGQAVVGLAVLRHVAIDGVDEVEVGYGFHESRWGKGLATEITAACLRYGWRELRLETIVALTRPANLASHRVLRKTGLELEREVSVDGVPNLLFRTRPGWSGGGQASQETRPTRMA